MNSIPNGIYHPDNSIIHRLDAFTKTVNLLILLAAVILSKTIIEYSILFAFLFFLIFISKQSFRVVLGSVKKVFWFFIIILIMNTCFYNTDNAWFEWWIFTPSLEGLKQGLNVVLRVIFLLILSNIVTMTTSPIDMTKAIEQMIYPLKFIGVPTSQVAMILSVAVQFISTLSEEAQSIKLAQTSRGAKFDSSRLSEKASAVMPLFVPIFIAAFKRADELSLAMEARGYRVNKKRKVKAPKLKAIDFVAFALCILTFLINLTLFN